MPTAVAPVAGVTMSDVEAVAPVSTIRRLWRTSYSTSSKETPCSKPRNQILNKSVFRMTHPQAKCYISMRLTTKL